jgi:hypothetical protein
VDARIEVQTNGSEDSYVLGHGRAYRQSHAVDAIELLSCHVCHHVFSMSHDTGSPSSPVFAFGYRNQKSGKWVVIVQNSNQFTVYNAFKERLHGESLLDCFFL